jgi:hypothetical protein
MPPSYLPSLLNRLKGDLRSVDMVKQMEKSTEKVRLCSRAIISPPTSCFFLLYFSSVLCTHFTSAMQDRTLILFHQRLPPVRAPDDAARPPPLSQVGSGKKRSTGKKPAASYRETVVHYTHCSACRSRVSSMSIAMNRPTIDIDAFNHCTTVVGDNSI